MGELRRGVSTEVADAGHAVGRGIGQGRRYLSTESLTKLTEEVEPTETPALVAVS